MTADPAESAAALPAHVAARIRELLPPTATTGDDDMNTRHTTSDGGVMSGDAPQLKPGDRVRNTMNVAEEHVVAHDLALDLADLGREILETADRLGDNLSELSPGVLDDLMSAVNSAVYVRDAVTNLAAKHGISRRLPADLEWLVGDSGAA